MRIKTLFKKLIGITKIVVTGFRMDEDGIVFQVRPRAGQTRCGKCGCEACVYDRRPTRLWRADWTRR